MLCKKIASMLFICLMGMSIVFARYGDDDQITIKFDRLKGHARPILTVASTTLSDNTSYIVSGCYDGNIGVWDFGTRKLLRMWQAHGSMITSVKIVNLGLENYIISGSTDKTIKVWSLNTGNLITELKAEVPITRIECIDDNYFASLSIDGKILIWSLSGRRVVRSLDHTGVMYASSVNGNLVTASKDIVKSWDIQSGRCYGSVYLPDTIYGLVGGWPAPYFVVTLEKMYYVWSWVGNKEQFYYPLQSGCNDMIRISKVYADYKVLNATQESSFQVYDYLANKLEWSAKVDDQSLGTLCVETINGYIIFGSLETGDLMISQEAVLPQ